YIQYSNLMDVTVISATNQLRTDFDLRGNALNQTVKRYSDINKTTLIETQAITNSPYDFMDRATHSSIVTKNSADIFVDRQEIDYLLYRADGNVIDQTIRRYDEADLLIDYKVIHNEYLHELAARRGNATHTTITRYSSDITLDPTTLIETQEIYNDPATIDSRGNIVDQRIELWVAGDMSRQTFIHNSNISNLGNAGNQEITTKVYNPVTDTADIVTGYQFITNRTFDSDANVKDQMVLNYLDKAGVLLDIQEIRNELFTSRGDVIDQKIATYSLKAGLTDYNPLLSLADQADILDVKVIHNDNIDSLSNAYSTTIAKYAEGYVDASGYIQYSNLMDVTVISATNQ
ncbi:MAG: hypothetical protein AABZ61_09580, partial [Bacteroidota bacterium]